MYEYHVTYGAFKKIIKSGSNIARNIHDPIKKAFSLDLNCSLHLQYWHSKHSDWVDCEESDEINEDTKLNVWQNVLDLQKLESSSLATAPSSNIGLRCSTPSINLTSSTVFEECSIDDQQPSRQRNIDDFPLVYKLPQFPLWLQNMLDTSSPLCKEPKCRRAVTVALFEDLLRYGYYPTSRMFQETARALVAAHPILMDKQSANGQSQDSWVLRLRDKFKKFRSRRAELCNAEELKRMKEKFGNKKDRSRLDTDNSLDNSLTPVKRMKKTFYVVQLDSDIFKEKMVVPSIWLDKNNTLCLLPPITDIEEVETLAKAQCTPKHGWQMQCVSFIQSFDTYSQAKESITKGKPVMIKLEEEEEEEEEHHKEVRGKRKRKILLLLEEYSVESDDDIEEGRVSTQDDCSMEDSVVPGPLIVKIETMQDSKAPEIHQQPGIDTTHNKNSSSVHSSIQHDNQLQVAGSSSPTKRRKIAPTEKNSEIKGLLVSIWNKMIEDENTECTKCDNLEDILTSKNQEIERLQNELQNRKHSLQESREKYKEMKRQYKEKKKEIKEPQEGKKFGSLVIAKQKLSLCRYNDYSKYVGDLLDICFGREILSQSVLKCPTKRTIKTNVLERDVINDIICYTIEKFSSVSVSMVRAAIRQKLNACHNAKNKMK